MNTTTRRCLGLFFASIVLGAGACEQKAPPPSVQPGPSADSTANAAPEYLAIQGSLPKEILDAETGKGAALAGVLAQHAATMQRLVDATKRADCDFGVDRSAGLEAMMPHLGKMRGLARSLRADAERALATNDHDAAAQRVAAMIRLGRHINQHGESMIEWMVGGAAAGLGVGFVKDHPELAKAAWKTDIQHAIAEATPGDPLGIKRVLAAERAIGVRSLRENTVPDMTSVGGRNWKQVPHAEREQVALVLDKLWERAIEAWDAPDADVKLGGLMREAEASTAKGLISAVDKMRKSATTLQADLNAASATLR